MAKVTFTARGFRALERFEWSPEDTTLLVGPNGSGKSTALSLLDVLRVIFERGLEAGLKRAGRRSLLSQGFSGEDLELGLSVGELRWTLKLAVDHRNAKLEDTSEIWFESLESDGRVVASSPSSEDGWIYEGERRRRSRDRSVASLVWDFEQPEWMREFVAVVESIRIYGAYELSTVKELSPTGPDGTVLHGTGQNLWSVLSTWKSSEIHYPGRFEFVVGKTKEAFPDIFGALAFDRGIPYIFHPERFDPADGLLPDRVADGLLTGLLHLTAVAGAADGGLVAIDEVENQLHPFALRALLSALRERAEEKALTVILTTHSPIVMNAFRDEPDRLYVLHKGFEPNPRSLTDIFAEDALAQVRLGDLYEGLEFGAPSRDSGEP